MEATANYRYEAVRFSPTHSENYPFQIVSSLVPLVDQLLFQMVTDLTLEEAKDLHYSLGVMLRGNNG